MAEVFHRVYTHAARDAFDPTGGRVERLDERDAESVLDASVIRLLDVLLRKTTPDGPETAWVVCRFPAKEWSYGCVITSYPDLIRDADGRDGVLNHARLVRSRAGEAWFDVADLVASAQDFGLEDIRNAPAPDRLRMYLDQLSGEQASLPERPVTIDQLRELPRDDLRDFLVASLIGYGREDAVRFQLPSLGANAMSFLAAAWAALPVGLQRSTPFAFEVADGCPVGLVLSRSYGAEAARQSSGTLDFVKQYLQLLYDTQADVLTLLRNPAVTTPMEFSEAVNRAMISAPLSVIADDAQAGKKMTKTKKQEPQRARGRESGGTLDPEIVAEMHRQYEAMQASLQDYARQCFELIDAKQTRGAETVLPATGQPVRRSPQRWWPWVATGLAAAAVLALIVVLFSRTAGREPEERTTTREQQAVESSTPAPPDTPAVSKEKQVLRDAIAHAKATNGQFAEELKTLIIDHPSLVARPVRDAAAGVPAAAADALEKSAQVIEAGKDLGPKNRDALRRLLLEVIAASAAAEEGLQPPNVDGKVDDLKPPLVGAVKEKYRVAGAANAQSQEFQAEAILRWLEKITP